MGSWLRNVRLSWFQSRLAHHWARCWGSPSHWLWPSWSPSLINHAPKQSCLPRPWHFRILQWIARFKTLEYILFLVLVEKLENRRALILVINCVRNRVQLNFKLILAQRREYSFESRFQRTFHQSADTSQMNCLIHKHNLILLFLFLTFVVSINQSSYYRKRVYNIFQIISYCNCFKQDHKFNITFENCYYT
jgi:hypothetical protein